MKFFYPQEPQKYQIFKTDQAIDIMRKRRTGDDDRLLVVQRYAVQSVAVDGQPHPVRLITDPWHEPTLAEIPANASVVIGANVTPAPTRAASR